MARRLSGRGIGWSLVFVGAASGCGAMHFSYHERHAEKHLEQARQIEAETLAPYEYETARLYLEKAREEASTAEYQDAVNLAKIADDKALAAARASRKRRREDSGAESRR